MYAQVKQNLWATKIFFLVRLSAAILISFIYILITAGVQDFYIRMFGETKFNYIIGGVLSLLLGVWLCNYLGSLVFMLVRGWHIAALSRAKEINDRNLSALDAGMVVFRKHMTSFAAVYGASIFITRFVEQGTEKIWDMLDDVPYLGSLSRVADFPVVRELAKNLLDTSYDAVIYYIIRYTKPGVGDDLEALPVALRKYLYCLPNVLGGSLSAYLLLNVLPTVIKAIAVLLAFTTQGIVGGVLMTVLMFPVFFMLKHVVFDPMEMIILISSFSKKINDPEPEDGVVRKVVDSILAEIGLEEMEESEESEEGETEEDAESEEPELGTEKPAKETGATPPVTPEELDLDVAPVFEPEGASARSAGGSPSTGGSHLDRLASMPVKGTVAGSGEAPSSSDSMASMRSLASKYLSEFNNAAAEPATEELPIAGMGDDDDDGPEEVTPPIALLNNLFAGYTADDLNSDDDSIFGEDGDAMRKSADGKPTGDYGGLTAEDHEKYPFM